MRRYVSLRAGPGVKFRAEAKPTEYSGLKRRLIRITGFYLRKIPEEGKNTESWMEICL